MSEKKELSAKYNPAEVEDKWYSWWLEHRCFHSEPNDKEPYTIVIPPPNVTGILHMGHVLNNTLNDVLIRKARMDGKNACWVPGTDHASIATESKVVARLKEKGISKEDLTREEFLKYAWEWKEEHGGIILQQLKKLGASCDWDRTRFTMEPELSDAVISTFCYFYKKGLIYRGVRMVNWDPVALTAISDDEVIHKDTKSHFYHLRYYISDGNGNPTDKYLVIATTRPETIMADSAICVNPADERYHWLKGKKVIIPLIGREIPVIEDSYVEMDFGTGCLKVTPAHDAHDYEIGLRHNLPIINIIDDHGKLTEEAVILVEVVFEHQTACEAQMVAVEHFRAKSAVERIVIGVRKEGDVGVVFVVQKVGVLHIGLATLCIEQDAEGVGNRQHLAALALLLQVADTSVHYIATLGIFPAILQVQLPDCGRVVPQVAVIIVMAEVVLIVCQQDGAQVLAQMPVDCGIEFGLEAAVAVQVYLHRRGIFGLQVFDIDLACDALRAVLDARCALAHRDALHPGARHIAQGVRH